MSYIYNQLGLIQSANKRLFRPKTHINVIDRSTIQSISVQKGYNEDGHFVLEECNHGGAELEEHSALMFDNDSHEFQPTGTQMITTCDKRNCNAVLIDGEWES